jgi:hypothetical protein
MFAWNALGQAVHLNQNAEWAVALRNSKNGEAALVAPEDARTDQAFVGDGSLLASDLGVRGFHLVLNDLAYLGQDDLNLAAWRVDDDLETTPEMQFDEAFEALQSNQVGNFLGRLATELTSFDWRNSRGNGLSPSEVEYKKALRGSGGYNVLRDRVFAHLTSSQDQQIARLAQLALEMHNA